MDSSQWNFKELEKEQGENLQEGFCWDEMQEAFG